MSGKIDEVIVKIIFEIDSISKWKKARIKMTKKLEIKYAEKNFMIRL